VERAIAQAEVLGLDIGPQPGFLKEPTRSELERMFLRLCHRPSPAET
jgi:hypothetical protein